jgi:hypothetical protein
MTLWNRAAIPLPTAPKGRSIVASGSDSIRIDAGEASAWAFTVGSCFRYD